MGDLDIPPLLAGGLRYLSCVVRTVSCGDRLPAAAAPWSNLCAMSFTEPGCLEPTSTGFERAVFSARVADVTGLLTDLG